MGLDNMTSEEEQQKSPCSPLSQRATSPILKRISKPFNCLLDSRKVTPSKTSVMDAQPPRRFSTTQVETGCGACKKKLSGKTVRLPNTQVKYHWKCLNCKGCELPFEDISFFVDESGSVYHPNVSHEIVMDVVPIANLFVVRSFCSCHPTLFPMLFNGQR